MERVTGQKYALCFEGTNNWDENFAFCVEEHKWDYFTRIYIGALRKRPHLGGRILTWGRRVPEAAEKSPDVGRRYRYDICVSH